MPSNTTAICPGTYDPVTVGHLDIITRGATKFGRVVVGLIEVPQRKSPLFDSAEREVFLRDALAGHDNIVVDGFNELVVEFARRWDAHVSRLDGLACGPVVLADTVGFIRDLPHDLVAAFRSTLAEARDADLLLHVVDASDPERDDRILDVEQVLKEIGADELPQVLVYNKVDLLRADVPAGEGHEAAVPGHTPQGSATPLAVAAGRVDSLEGGKLLRAWVSAVSGAGIDGLLGAIGERLGSERVRAELLLPADAGRLRARLHAQGLVAGEHVDEHGWHIRIDAPRALVEPLFGLPGGDGEWLRSRLLAAADAPAYNPLATPA